MQIVICFTYHATQKIQSSIVFNYYRSLGYKVDSFRADFLITPESDCRNEFFKRNRDADYIIYLDSDEIVLPGDMVKAIKIIEKTNKDVYRCRTINYLSANKICSSESIHVPIMAVINREKYNKKVKFKYNRNITGCDSFDEIPIKIHHLGYMLNPQWKLKNYAERKEFHEIGVVRSVMGNNGIAFDTPREVRDIIGQITCL